MSLTSSAVSELTVESGAKALFREWLAKYFDGSSHALSTASGVSAIFPASDITFDQSPSEQPLSDSGGVEIRIIIDPGQYTTCANAYEDGYMASNQVSISFWVIAKPVETAGLGNHNYLADNTSQLLFALLSNPYARYDLARKGITTIRPVKPRTYNDLNYARRLVKAKATLRYEVRFS